MNREKAPNRIKKEKYAGYRDEKRSEKQTVKNFRQTAMQLLALLKGHRVQITVVTLLAAVSAALNVIGPRYLGDIMDLINTQVDFKLKTGAMDFGAIFGILGTILLIAYSKIAGGSNNLRTED